MSITVSVACSGALMNSLKAAFDGGGSNGYLKVFAGTQPASGGAETTYVGAIPMAYPCGTVTGAVLNLSAALGDSPVLNISTPTWARIFNSLDQRVLDCRARLSSTAASSTDPQEVVIDVSAQPLVLGASLKLASGTFQAPT